VFQARSGTLTDPGNQTAIAQTEANLQSGTAPHVTQVVGPTTPVVGPGGDNWWLPRWLDRALPRIRIEEGELPKPVPAPTGASS
jgi:hypothetical protein